jgi:site-specific recombinase XerD
MIEDVKKVDEAILKEYLKLLSEKGFSAKTISRKLNSTRTFFKYLETNNIIDRSPATSIPHPQIEPVIPRVLTEFEYRALRDTSRADTRTYTIIEILLQTGIRIGELCRIEMSDLKIDPKGKSSMLKIAQYGSNPERKIPLNNQAVAAFDLYLGIRPKHAKTEQIFITKTGNPLLVRNIRASIDNTFKKAKIKKAKVNDLRNTFIAHHLAKGTNIFVLSKIIGHKRISTTEKYLGQIKLVPENFVSLAEL